MQASDLKIGALYDVGCARDYRYEGYADGVHVFSGDDGLQPLGVHPAQLSVVRESSATDLHAFAAGVAASNQARRDELASLRYEDYARRLGRHKMPREQFLDAMVRADAKRHFLADNFPTGSTFKLCGCECMSAGVRDCDVEYVTATPQGLQQLRLPFEMAAAVVLGHPV